MSAPLWQVRKAESADLGGVVFLWLESFWRSRHGGGFRFDGGKSVYWEAHEPRVHRLLARSEVTIACDPQAPAVIWAFSVCEGDTVHYVLAKRRFHREEISADMFRDLLGERLARPCVYTHELVEFRREEVRKRGLEIPESWRLDPYLLMDAA